MDYGLTCRKWLLLQRYEYYANLHKYSFVFSFLDAFCCEMNAKTGLCCAKSRGEATEDEELTKNAPDPKRPGVLLCDCSLRG